MCLPPQKIILHETLIICKYSCSPSGEGDGPVDLRVLTGLVQDVWDKFQELHASMQNRHRNEAQALWAVQHLQWTQKIKELGKVKFNIYICMASILFCTGMTTVFISDLPNSHVPLATPTN